MSDYLQPNWAGLEWSTWVPFEATRSEYRQLTQQAGLYRVRAADNDVLTYVGQTGRSLRARVMALRRNTLLADMPWNDPHTAAPSHWSFAHELGMQFASSVAPVELKKPDRMALECNLIWRYRKLTGESPWCNFGRLHSSHTKSANRSTGRRGARLSDGTTNPNSGSSVEPLFGVSDPMHENWMGLAWSDVAGLIDAETRRLPAESGVYKIMSRDAVVYIGESANLRSRLGTHACSDRHDARFSVVTLPAVKLKCQRLEVESDLVGGFYDVMRRAPAEQFIG